MKIEEFVKDVFGAFDCLPEEKRKLLAAINFEVFCSVRDEFNGSDMVEEIHISDSFNHPSKVGFSIFFGKIEE